ncbi:MAG: arsenosugar biosynthesis radical SAM protein ArsS [Nitrospirae bacterium]|nr:arsenosugar biosynthesis radical SAM protein ArsS [Nitrospirota bacterium]
MGYKCNLRCTHCHIEASPERKEAMSSSTVDRIIDILKKHDEITTLDITGGSPEYNPNYRLLVKMTADMGKKVIVRTNLAIYFEPGMSDLPEFLAEHKVKIVASLPCYTKDGVDGQRGKGTYDRAVSALKRLNKLGYGREGTGLEIDLMFNPAKEGVAPDQHMLENAYREKLKELHGITFNHLIALSNMPIGRLGRAMSVIEKEVYLKQLEEKFNPDTVKNVMCRHLISVAPDGTLYDCDFWQALKLSVNERTSNTVNSFDYASLSNRDIVTAPLCFMCTAGAGASCSGALA